MFMPPKHMLERDDLLSEIVARKLRPYKRTLRPKRRMLLRARKLLYACAVLPLLSISILVLLTRLGLVADVPSNGRSLVAGIHTVGAIVGALTGVLIAILAMAAQVNSQYIGGPESLFKVLMRRIGYMEVACLAGGTIGGALVGCIFDGNEPHWVLLVSVFILVFFGVVTVAAELWLLYVAVEAFGREKARELFVEELKEDNRASLLAEIGRQIALNVYVERVRQLGFDWSIGRLSERKGQVRYCLRAAGRFVAHVRFGPLERLAALWKLEPIPEDRSAIGSVWEHATTPTLCISPGDKLDAADTCLLVGGDGIDPVVQKMLDAAFIRRRRPPFRHVSVKWDDYGDIIRHQVREGSDRQLRNTLVSFYDIVRDYMDCLKGARVKHPSPTGWMPTTYEPPTLQAIGFSDIIENMKTVRNLSCLATLVYFVKGLGEVVFGIDEAVSYYTDVLRRLGDFYVFGRANSELSDAVKRHVVESYRTGPLFSIRHLIDEEKRLGSVEKLDLVREYVKVYYVELCAILSGVWRAADDWTFHELLDQLNRHLGIGPDADAVKQYEHAGSLYRRIEKAGSLGAQEGEDAKRKLAYARLDVEIQDLRHLGDIAVAAWLAESVNVGKMNAGGAKALIEECVGHVADVHRLVEVYLHAAGFGLHDDPLGYGWWTHTRTVAGKVYRMSAAFEKWIQPFWISVALKRLSSDKQTEVSVRKIRFLSPFRDYHYEQLRKGLKEVVEHKEKYEWFGGAVGWEGAEGKLLRIFGELKELQKTTDFEKLLGAPISAKKVDQFRRECLKGYLAERKISELIRTFKSRNTTESVTRWSGKPAVVDILGKEEFIEDWHVGFAGRDAIGDFVGQVETSQFSTWMQDNLKEVGTVTNLTDLPSLVKETATAMRDAGLNPRVVLIPEDHVYQSCFTSTSYWDRASDYVRNELPQWVAGFDSMQVFVWPRWEQDCVAVIDMDTFIAIDERSQGNYAPLEIDFAEMNADGIQKLLENDSQRRLKEEFEATQCDEATFARIKLKLRITANVRLGLVNAGAGLKLLLDENKVGVVCDKQAKVCHRLGCPLVEQIGAQNKEFHKTAALAVRRYGYQSCEKCDPLFGSYR